VLKKGRKNNKVCLAFLDPTISLRLALGLKLVAVYAIRFFQTPDSGGSITLFPVQILAFLFDFLLEVLVD
jgi:uncharacterized membrane protein (DUF485 family)